MIEQSGYSVKPKNCGYSNLLYNTYTIFVTEKKIV